MNGNRRAMCDARGCTSYEYDDLGRLTKVTEPDGKWIAYEYDGNSNRTKMTVHLDDDPLVEHVTEYDYYNNNLLHHVTDQLDGETTYTYKPNGLVGTITYPNQTKAVHTYVYEDAGGPERNWLRSITNLKSDNTTIIAGFTYSYADPWGKNGTRTQVLENILLPGGSDRIQSTMTYSYDDLYRLTGEVRTGDLAYSKSYTYDAAGNRTHMVADGVHTYYGYDAANKMTSPGTFTYDDKGNTTRIVAGTVTTDYTWDLQNRMIQWAKTGATTETYIYNAYGMRVRKTVGGTQTDFLLDGKLIVEEMTGSTVTSYLGPGIASEISGTMRTVYHPDGIGSTRAMSDGNQAVTGSGIYDAYGNPLTSGSIRSLGFAAQYRYHSDATQLNYVRARYFSPGLGRFISKDPIGNLGGPNLYAYAKNAPTNYTDNSGYSPVGVGIGIGVGIGVVCCGVVGFAGTGLTGMLMPDFPDKDQYLHCIAACHIRDCGTILLSWMCGWGKEIGDYWTRHGFGGEDWAGNNNGEWCSKQDESCTKCCQRLYPNCPRR